MMCEKCRGKGRVACVLCEGGRERGGACRSCGGEGRVPCADCWGMGILDCSDGGC